jgi:hypothetical protein
VKWIGEFFGEEDVGVSEEARNFRSKGRKRRSGGD